MASRFVCLGLLAVLMLGCSRSQNNDAKQPSNTQQRNKSSGDVRDAPRLRSEGEPNALIHESSPYLLQHAYNPVDWMPWGDEAFVNARKEDKPVFLSVGYATCHWCHVMEHESFENEAIAAYMNEHFVSIKVDREERPDIDSVYMTVTQGITGSGGWPMSVWLTPDRLPITAGTYFPSEDRGRRMGFLNVLKKIIELWENDRAGIDHNANRITEWLKGRSVAPAEAELSEAALRLNYESHRDSFDATHGGFGGAPKFPSPHRLMSLLRWHARNGELQALPMVEKTLQAMASGGIHDHIGGGFHRYSTDRQWLTPHFEKMLYDQALLSQAYLEAWLVTGKDQYADTVRNILDYVLRDLRDDKGAFHSAKDADSEGEEGVFYIWTMDELHAALGDEAPLAAYVWGCKEEGNFHDEAAHELTGANILHLPRSLSESAKAKDIPEPELRKKVEFWRKTLFDIRAKRERPLLDDKVLTDWNGLMIGAMARAGAVLNEPKYLQAARESADFILTSMVDDGRLLHRYRAGEAGIKGFAEDYAFLAGGLFELYQADLDPRWLREARRLATEMIRLFFDENLGLLTTQGTDEEDRMIAAVNETFDSAIPSANSASAYALIRLGWLLQDDKILATGRRVLKGMSGNIVSNPGSSTYALMALEWHVLPVREIVIAGCAERECTRHLIDEARSRFMPRTVLVLHESGDRGRDIRELVPFIAGQGLVDGESAAYVCENYSCLLPVTKPAELAKLLER